MDNSIVDTIANSIVDPFPPNLLITRRVLLSVYVYLYSLVCVAFELAFEWSHICIQPTSHPLKCFFECVARGFKQ